MYEECSSPPGEVHVGARGCLDGDGSLCLGEKWPPLLVWTLYWPFLNIGRRFFMVLGIQLSGSSGIRVLGTGSSNLNQSQFSFHGKLSNRTTAGTHSFKPFFVLERENMSKKWYYYDTASVTRGKSGYCGSGCVRTAKQGATYL